MNKIKRLAHGGPVARQTSPWILVHSMGKVGSYATFKAIQATRQFNVLHTHQLNMSTIDAYQNRNGDSTGHIDQALQFLDHVRVEDEVKLIISVREPIGRNVSAFFENLHHFGLQDAAAADVTTVIDEFINRYHHRVPIDWFTEQVEQPFGIDLWSMNLSAYRPRKSGRLSILVLRAEDSDEKRQDALSNFLQTDNLSLQRMNVGGEKPYAELYSAFKEAFRAPPQMTADLYRSNYLNSFYTQDEIKGFHDLWC